MGESHTLVNGLPAVSTLRREAWGNPTTRASPSCTLTSGSLDGEAYPTIVERTVGPRLAQVPIATSVTTPHHTNRRRRSTGDAQTVAFMEIQNVVELIHKNLFLTQTWIDALGVMCLVIKNCTPSVLCACVTVILYAVGPPWAPFIPDWSSSTRSAPVFTASTPTKEFNAVVGFYFIVIACMAHLVTKSFTVGNRLFTFSAGIWSLDPNAPGFWGLLRRNILSTSVALVVSIGSGTCVMELLRLYSIDFHKNGRVEVYILCVISYAHVMYAEVHLRLKLIRKVRRSVVFLSRSSVTPMLLDGIGSVVPAHSVDIVVAHSRKRNSIQPQRIVKLSEVMYQLLRAQALPVATFHIAFVFLYATAALPLKDQWQTMLLAGASQALKLALQEAAKRLQLNHSRQRHSARMVHTVMTVPTICIDIPIRLVFMQKGVNSSSIISSSLALVFFEVLFRVTKMFYLRYTVSARLANSRIIKRLLRRVNSRMEARDASRARAEYSRFLDWKNYKLRLHAAEIYADMHGKYISIGLAVAILYTIRTHPRYDLGYMSSSTDTQVLAASVQLVSGLTADLIACAFEGIQEVPMFESLVDEGAPLLRYLRLLMSVLTAVNVGVIALFAMKSEK
ncbi:unnamed protein product [Phytophthora fragariaefolia]|uniref:Unnamed protein product n=1 Tax=Phytophthora fragariaefolia TaxID=1490495 RepID=A0A9W6XT13_9STRA|nr:unnamed protein product [Phytophthora fragariaefolia]